MSTVGLVCATVSSLGLNKVFLFLLLYGAQDGGLLAALRYPAISAEPVEGEMCWVRSLGRRSNPSGHRPWEPLLERSVTVRRTRESPSWCHGLRAREGLASASRSRVAAARRELAQAGTWRVRGPPSACSLRAVGERRPGEPGVEGPGWGGAGVGLRRRRPPPPPPAGASPRCPGWWPGAGPEATPGTPGHLWFVRTHSQVEG